ncbi:MAG: cytochrome b/b6 domain-containing protein [Xanthobacteraceae bacterium]
MATAVTVILVGLQAARGQNASGLDNATCLGCHGQLDVGTRDANGQMRSQYTPSDHFAKSVHGALQCIDCHTSITEVPHNNPPPTPAQWRQQIPALCGSCHTTALNDYAYSVHGRQLSVGRNTGAAICTDCHTAHQVAEIQLPATRMAITQQCGACHAGAMASYTETYHGQLYALGYADTATCADCHSGHAILAAGNPASTMSSANRLKTCRTCHEDATAGFATFQPHATTDDFGRYPYTWIAAKAAWGMIFGVFGICWIHSVLWFYRELRERQQRRPRPHVRTEALSGMKAPQVRRWSAGWRFAHLVFALSVIVLVLTGIPALYPHTAWAPVLERLMGGPSVVGIVHRVAAVIMTGGFVLHFGYVGVHLTRNWKTFRIFGPYSLLPTWQDGRDLVAMLKWFVGAGPRPDYDHWNYQQKLDYWGSFSGVALLTVTGAMLWFKTLDAAYLPGWSFNVAAVVHGHESLFAAGYLFTVHYFVNHWRPDKFPVDIVMFTGSMPLDEFKREYGVEYARLVQTGELEHYLVEAPSRPMTLFSKIFGLGLVAVSVILLALMVNGISASF